MKTKSKSIKCASLVFGVGVTFCYVFFEWLYVLTSPFTFLKELSFLDKLSSFWTALFLFFLAFGISLLIITVLKFVLTKFRIKIDYTPPDVVTAFILSCLTLVLANNFTYTLFTAGVVSFRGYSR